MTKEEIVRALEIVQKAVDIHNKAYVLEITADDINLFTDDGAYLFKADPSITEIVEYLIK